MSENIEEDILDMNVCDSNLYYLKEGNDLLNGVPFDEQKQKISKLLMNNFKSKNLNIFIGSGCSKPAIGLMGETFSTLKQNESEHLVLGSYDGNNNDIEGYLNWLNTGIKFYEQNPDETDLLKKLEESFAITKKALIKSICTEYDSTEQAIEKTKSTYQQFYNTIFSIRSKKDQTPVNIYTTNYDLFNEVAMESLNIHYTNGFRGSVNREFDPTVFNLRLVDEEIKYKDRWNSISKYVKLYKLHGSIDWSYKIKNSGTVKVVNHSSIYEGDITDNYENVVIFPTINKHLETQQTPYSELFRALSVNLQKQDSTLIVLGYGFPDQHINHLISQSLASDDFNLIIFGNEKEENAQAFIKEHISKPNFHFIGGKINNEISGHHFSHVISYILEVDVNEE
ncbi:SIR2 family protein [Bacillus sp. FSL K6-6483]|uniref:SIR2 family protein n=1 Tax=Shouchella tritolerans TaxID=2979466 RepID=UPI0021E75D50|nr:SIR2 family protein [Shouchella tritolerans]